MPLFRKQIKTIGLQFIIMISCSIHLPSWSQTSDWHLTRFTATDGLASSDISTLFQDSRHYMWIGHSAGLSRFDGYDFENFLFVGKKRLGKVYAITEDVNRTIWIGAEGGLFIYRHNDLSYVGIDSGDCKVFALAWDKNGNLLLGTDMGFAMFTTTMMRRSISHDGSAVDLKWIPVKEETSDDPIHPKHISRARDGTIFLSDRYSVYRYDGHTITQVHTITENRDYITGIVGWNENCIYISSQLSGFWKIEAQDIQQFSFSDGIGNFLTQTMNRLLYFAREGIYAFDPATEISQLLISIPEKYLDWGSCVLMDKESNIWIGTHEELLLARPDLFHDVNLPHLEGFNELFSLYENREGPLLVGGNRGRLFVTNQSKDPTSFSLWRTVFPKSEVLDIYTTNTGDTWFCSGYEGLSLLRNGQITHYTMEDGLRSNGNYKFLFTSDKELFVCGDNGISKINYGGGNRISFQKYYTREYTIVTDGIANPDGSLLLGSDHGLMEWRNDSLYNVPIVNTERNNPSITAIKRDKSDQIWLTTLGDGILMCQRSADKYVLKKKFTARNGTSSSIYLQLLLDENNIIWATGYKDIIRIEQKSENDFLISTYNSNHGFTNKSFHSAKMLQDTKGLIWMATSAGLVYWEPDLIEYSQSQPVCNLTGISYFDKKGNHTEMPIFGVNQFSHHTSFLSFNFSGLHLSDPTIVLYSYRLLGADSGWINIGDKRTVTFQSMSPGDYVFQVKSSLGSDIWSNVESYPFEVLSPWWQRVWFIFLSIVSLIGLGIMIVRRRENNILKVEAQKTEMQELKAISLQHQLEIEQILNFFATSMGEQSSIESMLWDVAKNCISRFGFEDCVIYLKDDKGDVLIQKAAWGPKTTMDDKINDPIEIPVGKGIVGSVAQSGIPEIVSDTSIDDRYLVDDKRRGSEISVPILDANTVIGVIDSEHSQKHFFTEWHLQILSTIASLITSKMDEIKAKQQARKKEMEVLKLNNDLSHSQLIALRTQMNPHFIFNTLNSVQQYILQGNVIEANKYLSKFSKLQREILNHCDHHFIFLEKEIEMLNLYLQLEQLRFDGSFAYQIDLHEDMDPDEIKIPPMMVQPFVENAIWHGLMPKRDNRKLDLLFRMIDEDILSCTIRDNGIGRKAASRMQRAIRSGPPHKSKGFSLVNERLNVLRQQYNQPFNVSITDLADKHGNPQGTQVSLIVFAGD